MNVSDIENIVLDVSELKQEAILSNSRKQELVKARQLIMYFAVLYFKKSMTLYRIGSKVNRDHATVLHSVKVIELLEFQKFEPYLSWKKEIEKRIIRINWQVLNFKVCKYSQVFSINK